MLLNHVNKVYVTFQSTKGTESVAGSTLLQVLDSFALNNHNASDESNGTDNIGMKFSVFFCMRY